MPFVPVRVLMFLLEVLATHLSSSSSIDCSLTFENEDDDDEDDLAYASSWVVGETRVKKPLKRFRLLP